MIRWSRAEDHEHTTGDACWHLWDLQSVISLYPGILAEKFNTKNCFVYLCSHVSHHSVVPSMFPGFTGVDRHPRAYGAYSVWVPSSTISKAIQVWAMRTNGRLFGISEESAVRQTIVALSAWASWGFCNGGGQLQGPMLLINAVLLTDPVGHFHNCRILIRTRKAADGKRKSMWKAFWQILDLAVYFCHYIAGTFLWNTTNSYMVECPTAPVF